MWNIDGKDLSSTFYFTSFTPFELQVNKQEYDKLELNAKIYLNYSNIKCNWNYNNYNLF